jgi:exopolysaccharide biosynthesis polyprenyl glycosylphosphotransferase
MSSVNSSAKLPASRIHLSDTTKEADILNHFPVLARQVFLLASKFLVRAKTSRWMAYDALAAFLALNAGYWLSPKAGMLAGPHWITLLVFILLAIVAGHISALYERPLLLSGVRVLTSSLLTSVLAILGLSLFHGLVVYDPIGRWILVFVGILYFTWIFSLRYLAHLGARLYKIRVLYVGNENADSQVLKYLEKGDRHHTLAAFCAAGASTERTAEGECIPSLCREHRIDEIIVAEELMTRRDVLEQCFRAMRLDVALIDECTFYEEAFEQVPVEQINENWFYGAKFGTHKPVDVALKRTLDIIVASLGLILSLPLMLALFVLIPLTSRGPAIYSQIRRGRFGVPFRIYKFRTMRVDAEQDQAQWAIKDDPRATPLGKILRKLRLDETPQFWNVLRGEMSFVGPRPERPEMIEKVQEEVPYFNFRHWVRPGITGLAQIRFPYGASIEDSRNKLQHDLYYIKNFRILLDIQIILRTISALMKGSR